MNDSKHQLQELNMLSLFLDSKIVQALEETRQQVYGNLQMENAWGTSTSGRTGIATNKILCTKRRRRKSSLEKKLMSIFVGSLHTI